jgi:hypothetical protein
MGFDVTKVSAAGTMALPKNENPAPKNIGAGFP